MDRTEDLHFVTDLSDVFNFTLLCSRRTLASKQTVLATVPRSMSIPECMVMSVRMFC